MIAAILFALPALLLWALLALGRYPGECPTARIAQRRRTTPRAARALVWRRRPNGRTHGLRERLAGSLAGRAPPRRPKVTTPSTT